jgi:hypothetical protein
LQYKLLGEKKAKKNAAGAANCARETPKHLFNGYLLGVLKYQVIKGGTQVSYTAWLVCLVCLV